MSDNSDRRKKALIFSVLAFLLVGGGIFLFFVVQGSNELTGKGRKNSFTYGSAAREGVVSLFRTVGIFPDDEEVLVKQTEARMAARGFLPDGERAAADISDWMATGGKAASASGSSSWPATPTSVPKMSRKGGGTLGGGGGSKSAGSVTRFGGESATGTTSVTGKAQAGASGTTDKGTLGTLKNARSLLGEGLRSNSAMTVQSKWGQSFGVGGSGKSGNLAYSKTGLVGLDKIKSGEIGNLKMPNAAPEAGAFERDKEAESKDAGLQAAKQEASEKSKEDEQKNELAETLADAGTDALSKSGKDDKSGPAGADPGQAPITDEEKEEAKNMAFFQPTSLGGGATMQDQKVDITRTPDGGVEYEISGEMVTSTGEVVPYKDVITKSPDGTLKFDMGS